MADIPFVAVFIAFFALMVGFVRLCERIVGTEDVTTGAGGDAPDVSDAMPAPPPTPTAPPTPEGLPS